MQFVIDGSGSMDGVNSSGSGFVAGERETDPLMPARQTPLPRYPTSSGCGRGDSTGAGAEAWRPWANARAVDRRGGKEVVARWPRTGSQTTRPREEETLRPRHGVPVHHYFVTCLSKSADVIFTYLSKAAATQRSLRRTGATERRPPRDPRRSSRVSRRAPWRAALSAPRPFAGARRRRCSFSLRSRVRS